MSLLRAQSLSYRYETEDASVFENVSFSIGGCERIGLIGPNGCGKTTLLRLLTGELESTSGELLRDADSIIGYLPQELNLPDEMTVADHLWSADPVLGKLHHALSITKDFTTTEAFDLLADYDDRNGYRFEAGFERVVTDFGFDGETLGREIGTLSGGEKTKIALARLLLLEQDFLLLDEPTNHLDVETLQWLEGYLVSSRFPMVIVSHDRHFLDTCVTSIWELASDGLRCFSGNYSFYKQQKEEEFARNLELYEQQQKKISQLRRVARERRQWAMTYQAETGPEGYAPVFESIVNTAKKAMKRAKTIEHRIQRMIEREEAVKPRIERKRTISFSSDTVKNRFILSVNNLTKRFDDNVLFEGFTMSVEHGVRLAVIGPNGSGKTTLLRILEGSEEATSGTITWVPQARVAYYAQEFEGLSFNAPIIDEVLQGRFETGLETFARTVLGSLGMMKDKVFQQIASLSLGERSKVALAKIICSGANVLLLDEPTNHLEISSREMVEQSLEQYDGTVIFVSHDRYFVDRCATAILDLTRDVTENATHIVRRSLENV